MRAYEWTELISLTLGCGLVWSEFGWRVGLAVFCFMLWRNARDEWERNVDGR